MRYSILPIHIQHRKIETEETDLKKTQAIQMNDLQLLH